MSDRSTFCVSSSNRVHDVHRREIWNLIDKKSFSPAVPYERLLESQLIMGQTHTIEKFSILLLIISIVLLKINRKRFKIYYSND